MRKELRNFVRWHFAPDAIVCCLGSYTQPKLSVAERVGAWGTIVFRATVTIEATPGHA